MYVFKKKNYKIIIGLLSCVVFLFITLLVESSVANTTQSSPDYLFKIESSPEDFEFNFLNSDNTTSNSEFIFDNPTKINSKSELSVLNAYKDTRYVMSQDAVLDTIIAKDQEKRFHTKLSDGQVILDTRQTSQSVQTIQVGNTFLKPFTNGIYYLSKNNESYRIGSLQGSFTLGVYNESGDLSSTLLIHRYQEVSFEGRLDIQNPQVSSLSTSNFLDNFRFSEFYGIDQSVLEGELFSLTFKGKTVKATDSKSLQASLSGLNFNQRKKNFIEVYPFYKKLEDAKQAIRQGDTDQVTNILAEARGVYTDSITNNPESQSLYAETANANLQLISGLNPLSKYNILKVFMADTFSSSLDSVTALKLSLSLLEDINYGYDNSKPDISVRSEQVLARVISSQGLRETDVPTKVNLLIVIDNIIGTYPQSLTTALFNSRETIVSALKEEADDQDLINELEARKVQFIQDIISDAKDGRFEVEKAKDISFTIIKTLPEDLQETYRQELNDLDQ